MKLWQLKNLKTNEYLNSPQPLPENWGPIFGLAGVKEKLNDLSWAGISDQGWFEVGDAPDPVTVVVEPLSAAASAIKTAKQYLRDSDWSMLSDVPMTVGDKQKWIDYRKVLREIDLQEGFPDTISWPAMPE